MGKVTDEQLSKAKSFVLRRDRHANLLGQSVIAFEKTKAAHIQAIELIGQEEQVYMAALARDHGIDPNRRYGIDYETGELKEL